MKYLVTNAKGTKGILIDAIDCDNARKLATNEFYSPFPRKDDLNIVQVYEENKHLFVSSKGNKIFDCVQFHCMGGVTTSYNCTIDTKPTQDQLNFINRPITYIKFFQEKNRF